MSARGNVEQDGYRVYSRATEIARTVRGPEGFVTYYSPSGTYSVTTSRQQNLCAALLPGEKIRVEAAPRGHDLTIG